MMARGSLSIGEKREKTMEKAQNIGFWRASAPRIAGVRPHLLAVGAIALIAGACATTDGNQVTSPSALGMTDQTPPYFSDGQTTIYEVQLPVKLPVRAPTQAERDALSKTAAPFPRAPFISVGDIRTEIRYTLTNLDNKTNNVEILIDPWNEFVQYKPGIQIVSDEQTTPDLSGWDKFVPLHAKQRLQGTITSDDTREVAVDLATVYNIDKTITTPAPGQNLNALFNHAFNLQNRSTGYDPLIHPYIPAVVPAMTGFVLGLRTFDAANIAIEVQVDVVDTSSDQNKLIRTGMTLCTGNPGTSNTPDGTTCDATLHIPTTILQPPKPPVMN